MIGHDVSEALTSLWSEHLKKTQKDQFDKGKYVEGGVVSSIMLVSDNLLHCRLFMLISSQTPLPLR